MTQHRVRLLQEKLRHEEQQRKRLWSIVQELKRDIRAAKHPKQGRMGMALLDTRALTEEVSTLSTQLRRAAQNAQNRNEQLAQWVSSAAAIEDQWVDAAASTGTGTGTATSFDGLTTARSAATTGGIGGGAAGAGGSGTVGGELVQESQLRGYKARHAWQQSHRRGQEAGGLSSSGPVRSRRVRPGGSKGKRRGAGKGTRRRGDAGSGVVPGNLREDSVLSSSVAALYMEAAAQAEGLSLLLTRLDTLDKLVTQRAASHITGAPPGALSLTEPLGALLRSPGTSTGDVFDRTGTGGVLGGLDSRATEKLMTPAIERAGLNDGGGRGGSPRGGGFGAHVGAGAGAGADTTAGVERGYGDPGQSFQGEWQPPPFRARSGSQSSLALSRTGRMSVASVDLDNLGDDTLRYLTAKYVPSSSTAGTGPGTPVPSTSIADGGAASLRVSTGASTGNGDAEGAPGVGNAKPRRRSSGRGTPAVAPTRRVSARSVWRSPRATQAGKSGKGGTRRGKPNAEGGDADGDGDGSVSDGADDDDDDHADADGNARGGANGAGSDDDESTTSLYSAASFKAIGGEQAAQRERRRPNHRGRPRKRDLHVQADEEPQGDASSGIPPRSGRSMRSAGSASRPHSNGGAHNRFADAGVADKFYAAAAASVPVAPASHGQATRAAPAARYHRGAAGAVGVGGAALSNDLAGLLSRLNG